MEFTEEPVITKDQIFELEMHSFINILNVVSAQLQLIRLICREPEPLDQAITLTTKLADAIRSGNRSRVQPDNIDNLKKTVFDAISKLGRSDPPLLDNPEFKNYIEIFEQIFDVLDSRIEELIRRRDHPELWERFPVNAIRNELINFLGAIEKNSRGRYRIVFNIAEQEEKDYLVHVNITSDYPDCLPMPLLIKDTVRDLIANARKYTDPGGKIDIGLSTKSDLLRFVVEDTGRGIPDSELRQVVRYGYRASNVMDEIRTMGDGLGLTKAHYIVKRFGGRFWIDSVENRGTTVRIEIPIPAEKSDLAPSLWTCRQSRSVSIKTHSLTS